MADMRLKDGFWTARGWVRVRGGVGLLLLLLACQNTLALDFKREIGGQEAEASQILTTIGKAPTVTRKRPGKRLRLIAKHTQRRKRKRA